MTKCIIFYAKLIREFDNWENYGNRIFKERLEEIEICNDQCFPYFFVVEGKEELYDKNWNIVNSIEGYNFLTRGIVGKNEFCDFVARKHKGIPLNPRELTRNVSYWWEFIQPNRKIKCIKLHDLINGLDINEFIINDSFFIKSVQKGFSLLISPKDIKTKFSKYIGDTEFEVIISQPINILPDNMDRPLEFRCYIMNNKCISVSRYDNTFSRDIEYSIYDYANELIVKIQTLPFPKYYVMDLCITENGIDIVEFNKIESSGRYAENKFITVLENL